MTKIVLWPFIPALKQRIIEDALFNERKVMFVNSVSGEYELIDSDSRMLIGSLDTILNELDDNTTIHLLYHDKSVINKILGLLKRKRIKFIEKSDIYT